MNLHKIMDLTQILSSPSNSQCDGATFVVIEQVHTRWSNFAPNLLYTYTKVSHFYERYFFRVNPV